jgi:hypothetical protein
VVRPSRRQRKRAKLHCNNCGHDFEGLAWFVSVESSDRGTLGWNEESAIGTRCPACKSNLVGFK